METERVPEDIFIIEESPIVRNGLAHMLGQLPDLGGQIVEIDNREQAIQQLSSSTPRLVIINPDIDKNASVSTLCRMHGTRALALLSCAIDRSALHNYDAFISINDSAPIIQSTICGVLRHKSVRTIDQSVTQLSQREKEVIACIVKGMTNREIADQMRLSIHTVIAHRRNINQKLKIHSTSKLILYAIQHGVCHCSVDEQIVY